MRRTKTHLSDVQILPCVLLQVSPSFLSFLYLKGGREGRGEGGHIFLVLNQYTKSAIGINPSLAREIP